LSIFLTIETEGVGEGGLSCKERSKVAGFGKITHVDCADWIGPTTDVITVLNVERTIENYGFHLWKMSRIGSYIHILSKVGM
jgi:hypothetical protein